MSNPWYSYFVLSDDQTDVANRVLAAYQSAGWATYDPFPGGSGTPFTFKSFAKQFVLPGSNGSVRIVSESVMPAPVLAEFSRRAPVLRAWLTAVDAGWEVIRSGSADTSQRAFGPFMRPGHPLEDITRALGGHIPMPDIAGTGTGPLPKDVAQLAQDRSVDPKQAQRLTERMSSSLFNRFGGAGGAARDSAQAFLNAGIDWNSPNGRRVRAGADVLIVPNDWRQPDYVQAKDAFQAMRALARNPKAMLTASERNALDLFPFVQRYKALFFGKP